MAKYRLRRIVDMVEYPDVTRPGLIRYFDVLECGHLVRSREADSTAEKIRWVGMALAGKVRRRRCRFCGYLDEQNERAEQ